MILKTYGKVLQVKKVKNIFRQIHLREYVWFVLAMILIACQARLDLLFPEYIKNITLLLQNNNTPFYAIVPLCLAMLACAGANLLCGIGSVYFTAKLAGIIAKRLRTQIFGKVLDFSLKEVNEFTVPSLLTRCTLDITQIQTFIAMLPMIIVRAPLTGILAVINLSSQNYIWTGVIASIVFMIIVFVIFLIKLLTPRMKIVNALTDKLNI